MWSVWCEKDGLEMSVDLEGDYIIYKCPLGHEEKVKIRTWVTKEKFEEMYGLSTATLYRLIAKGKIIRRNGKGRYMYAFPQKISRKNVVDRMSTLASYAKQQGMSSEEADSLIRKYFRHTVPELRSIVIKNVYGVMQ